MPTDRSPTVAAPRAPLGEDVPSPNFVPAPAASPVGPSAAGEPMFLSRAALMARPIRTVSIFLKSGERLKLRALKQGERERLDDEALDKQYQSDGTMQVRLNNRGFQAKALAMCMINDDGSPYWDTVEQGQQALAELDDALFDEMFEPCDKLNVLTAKAREALGKGSAPTPSSNS